MKRPTPVSFNEYVERFGRLLDGDILLAGERYGHYLSQFTALEQRLERMMSAKTELRYQEFGAIYELIRRGKIDEVAWDSARRL